MKSKKLVEIPTNQKRFIDGILCTCVEDLRPISKDPCDSCVFIRSSVTCKCLACCKCERTDGKSCHFERVFNN